MSDFDDDDFYKKPRKKNLFDDDDDAAAPASVQRSNSKVGAGSPAISFSATRNDVSIGGTSGRPSLASTPTTLIDSKPSPASRDVDLTRMSMSASSLQVGRQSTGATNVSISGESLTPDPVRLSIGSTSHSLRENTSTPSFKNSSPVADQTARHQMTALAISQASINSQRRQSFAHAAPVTVPADAIRLLLVNDPEQRDKRETPFVCLEQFRSLASKKKLFSAAMATHDGNVILTVIRFLRSTLDFDLFAAILQSDPAAARQYLFYLKQCKNTDDIERLQTRLQRVDQSMLEKDQLDGATKFAQELRQRAVLEKFKAIVKTDSPIQRKEAFHEFARSEAGTSPLLTDYARKSGVLIEIQQKLDAIEAVESKSQSFVYSEFPLDGMVTGKTLGETLRHCAVYHLQMDPSICTQCDKKEPPVHLNAACLKKYFNVSEKVFQIAITRALTQSRRYELIDKILAPKGISGLFSVGSKVKPAVSADRVIDVIMYTLKKFGRLGISLPSNIRTYVQYIENPDTMETVAIEYQLPDVVTDIYCQRRDRTRLIEFMQRLPPNHPEGHRARSKLEDSSIKWKK